MPETGYKFRVQAVNAIGAGAFSAYAKLTTQPAPPAPPRLECSGAGHNYIKLKWGENGANGKVANTNPSGNGGDFTKYFVEMYVLREVVGNRQRSHGISDASLRARPAAAS